MENTNVGDKKQVKKAEVKETRGRMRELEDIKSLLETPRGRRFYWRLLSVCGVFRLSFTGNSETFFREGERNIGLKFLADLNEAMPEAYQMMLKEQKENENV